MRSLLAILLLSVINLPLVTPALFRQAESELPLCCRLAGKHKCALERAGRRLQSKHPGPSIAERCPFTSGSRATPATAHRLLVNGFRQSFAHAVLIFTADYLKATAPRPLEQAHRKRGPPALLA